MGLNGLGEVPITVAPDEKQPTSIIRNDNTKTSIG